MKPFITTIGSATRDIYLIPETEAIKILEDPLKKKNLKHMHPMISFELGAKLGAKYLSIHIGGTAVNVAIGLKRLGIESAVNAIIGGDNAGRIILKELQKEGVDISQIRIIKDKKTDRSLIIIHPKTRERTIFVNKSIRQAVSYNFSQIESSCLYVSSLKYSWEKVFTNILKIVKKKKIRLFFTPGIKQVKAGLVKLKKFLAYVEIVFLNLDEAISLTKVNDFEDNNLEHVKEVAGRIQKYGPKLVVITNGDKGVYVLKKKFYHFSSHKVKVVDVTGAGDAFASGFLACYLKGYSVKCSTLNGIANSCAVIQEVSTTRGLLYTQDLIKD